MIIFIGDGMSIGTTTAARILWGQENLPEGEYGEEHYLSFEEFPHMALSKVRGRRFTFIEVLRLSPKSPESVHTILHTFNIHDISY